MDTLAKNKLVCTQVDVSAEQVKLYDVITSDFFIVKSFYRHEIKIILHIVVF